MKTSLPLSPCSLARFFPLGWVCVVFALLLGPAWLQAAERTPAGTIIRNQAKIEYQRDDMNGRVFEASSNEVLIRVLPVYGIDVIPDHTNPVDTPGNEAHLQYALSETPRAEVTFQYLLTFTGNVADTVDVQPTFSHAISDFAPQLDDGDTGFLIYRDEDENGAVNTGDVLLASWRDSNLDGILDAAEISTTTIGVNFEPGSVVSLLVSFFVPDGRSPGDQTYFGLDAFSAGDPTKTDIGNISLLQIIDGPLLEIRKTTNLASVAPGNPVTYTLTTENVGSAAAQRRSYTVDGTDTYEGVLIFDVIPTDLTTSAPFTISNPTVITDPTAGAGTFIYSNEPVVTGTATDPENAAFDPTDAVWDWSTTYAAGDTVIAWVSSDGTNHFDLSETAGSDVVSYSFELNVPATSDEQSIRNEAFSHYSDGVTNYTISSINTVLTVVEGASNVLIRDTDYDTHEPPSANLTPSDDGAGTTNDTQTQVLAQPGRSFFFTNRVINTGVAADTFNITIDTTAPGHTLPAGWRVDFLKREGLSPLTDTGVDGIVDTGIIQPYNNPPAHATPALDEFVDIVMRVTIPEGATDSGTPVFNVTVVATSVTDSSVSDTTVNTITSLGELAMNLENNFGDPPSTPTNENTNQLTGDAGGFVVFPLIIENDGPADGDVDSYTMTATLPGPDWRVTFHRDLNSNGVLDNNELVPQFETPEVEPGDAYYMLARVFIPEGTDADSNYTGTPTAPDTTQDPYDVTFRATSTNLPVCNDPLTDLTCDAITNEVLVNYQTRFELQPDRNGSIEPGGTVTYLHTVRNFSDRALRVYLSLTLGRSDWQYTLLASDGSGTLLPTAAAPDANTYAYVDLAERVNAEEPTEATFLLRIFAPSSSSVGTTDVTTLLALAWDPTTNVALPTTEHHAAYDVTTVTAGDLQLTKESSVPMSTRVQPGGQITYTTTYFNKSAFPISDVIIHDPISPYTSYVRGTGSVTPPPGYAGTVDFEISTNGGISYSADDPVPGAADPTITNVRVRFSDALEPGDEGDYSFTVQVK